MRCKSGFYAEENLSVEEGRFYDYYQKKVST
jgi:hypothetical protein